MSDVKSEIKTDLGKFTTAAKADEQKSVGWSKTHKAWLLGGVGAIILICVLIALHK